MARCESVDGEADGLACEARATFDSCCGGGGDAASLAVEAAVVI